MPKPLTRGWVKFYKEENGWGGIESEDTPGDVWVHFSVIEMPGFRSLYAGQEVEFRWEEAEQDSWHYRATWVRPLTDEPALPDHS
jgi:cold shock protein